MIPVALADFIEANRAFRGPLGVSVDDALGAIDATLQGVHLYQWENLSHADCPCVEILEPELLWRRWLDAPYGFEEAWRVPIVGYVVHGDTDDSASAIREFAEATGDLFMARDHLEIPIPSREGAYVPPGHRDVLYYIDEVPVSGGRTEFEEIGDGPLLRRFELTWNGRRKRYLPETTP
jgi:hypothetical protein